MMGAITRAHLHATFFSKLRGGSFTLRVLIIQEYFKSNGTPDVQCRWTHGVPLRYGHHVSIPSASSDIKMSGGKSLGNVG